jgi:hypothetical protein
MAGLFMDDRQDLDPWRNTSDGEVTSDRSTGNTNCSNRVARMNNEALEIELQALVARGIATSSDATRMIITNKLIRLLMKHKSLFWRSGVKQSCFEEGWTKTLDNFYQNLWVVTTSTLPYCDSSVNIVRRLKTYLCFRISKAEQDERGYRKPSKIKENAPLDNRHRKFIEVSFDAPSRSNQDDDTSLLDRFDDDLSFDSFCPSDDYLESLTVKIAKFRELVTADATGELKQLHITKRPDLNCQAITLLRYQGMKWGDLEVKLDVTTSTASSFFQKKCIPLLKRLYGETLGFLVK